MIGKKIIPVLFIMLATVACGPGTIKKPGKALLLPDDKLVAVLTDTYLAAGILDVPEVRDTWGKRDSIKNYIDVIESHGCTYQQVEATMQYYFASRPKKIARIFDRVTGNLLELEVMVQNESQPVRNAGDDNLWTGKASYALPEDFTRDPIWFDIPVDSPGLYILKADIRVYADDKSLDPRVTVFFSTTDSTGAEIRDFWDEVKLTKNGQVQNVDIRKTFENPGLEHIKGWLLNHTIQQGVWEKHARIRNISLRLEKDTIVQE